MTPLRIDINLTGPIERPTDPIHLDGLVAHRMIRRDLPADVHLDRIKEALLSLPLARIEIGGDWVWAASTIAFVWTSNPGQAFATLGMRAQDIAAIQRTGFVNDRRPDSRIDTSRGKNKGATYARDRQWASHATAFCIGDEDEIRDLLSGLDQIGPRRRLGAGRVSSVTVERDERAMELWKRRSLPMAAENGGRMAEGSYRLPAFDPANRTIVRTNPLELPIA